MDDPQILNHLGLSDDDLRDYLTKFGNFYSSLNDAQKAFAARSMPSPDVTKAAAAVGPGVSPDRYKAFLAARSANPAVPSFMCPTA